MIVELFSASPNFKFSERTFYILWNERQCVARIEAVVLTQLIPRSHDVTSTVGKQVVLYPLPPARITSSLGQISVYTDSNLTTTALHQYI